MYEQRVNAPVIASRIHRGKIMDQTERENVIRTSRNLKLYWLRVFRPKFKRFIGLSDFALFVCPEFCPEAASEVAG
jgi:hypothetical protein